MESKTLILAISLSIIGIFTQWLTGLNALFMQSLFLFIGLLAYYIIKKLDPYLIVKISKLFTIIGLFLLIALLLFGSSVRGSKRWFNVLGINIQPSVFFLPFFLLTLIDFLLIYQPKNFKDFYLNILIILIPVFLVFKQPDLGTSLIVFSCLFSVFLYSGIYIRHFLSFLFLIPFAITIMTKFLKTYQIQRLISFINPYFDPGGINYNSLQSVIAIGSGGLLGKGFLKASQSKLFFLPEAHTDFIFATFTESFGFLGAMILILNFYFFLKSILPSQLEQKKRPYYFLYSIGLFTYILMQFVFNVGMNLRLLPVVGVPLPLISYGGSTILTIYIFIAIREKLSEL